MKYVIDKTIDVDISAYTSVKGVNKDDSANEQAVKVVNIHNTFRRQVIS